MICGSPPQRHPWTPWSYGTLDFCNDRVYPNVAKVGGLQSLGVKGEIVVGYLDPLTTKDLKSSGFPVVLGRLVAS